MDMAGKQSWCGLMKKHPKNTECWFPQTKSLNDYVGVVYWCPNCNWSDFELDKENR